MTQTSNKFHGKTTKIKFILLDEEILSLHLKIILLGCGQEDKDSKDALCSMLGKTFVVEHEGRKIKSIKLEK